MDYLIEDAVTTAGILVLRVWWSQAFSDRTTGTTVELNCFLQLFFTAIIIIVYFSFFFFSFF